MKINSSPCSCESEGQYRQYNTHMCALDLPAPISHFLLLIRIAQGACIRSMLH